MLNGEQWQKNTAEITRQKCKMMAHLGNIAMLFSWDFHFYIVLLIKNNTKVKINFLIIPESYPILFALIELCFRIFYGFSRKEGGVCHALTPPSLVRQKNHELLLRWVDPKSPSRNSSKKYSISCALFCPKSGTVTASAWRLFYLPKNTEIDWSQSPRNIYPFPTFRLLD